MGLFSRRQYDNEPVTDPNMRSSNNYNHNNTLTGHHGPSNNPNNAATVGDGTSNNYHNSATDRNGTNNTFDNAGHGYNTTANNYNNNNNNVTDGNYDNTTANNYNNNNVTDGNYDNNGRSYEKRGRTGGLFSRGPSGNHGRHSERRAAKKRAAFDIDSGHYNVRPSFGQWLKFTWLDILTMVIMGMIGLGVYNASPAPSRSFPITFSDGEVVYPQFAYPLRKEIVPIWLAALLGSLIPIFIILVMQIRIRSFWDVNNAIIGLLYSLITAAVFQVFLKWLIGGLRPHFLDVCDPDPALISAGGNGFRRIMFDRTVCRGDQNQINDSLESFPSGHSTAAWAGFLYLYFYLNAKMKVFSNFHVPMWKLIVLYAPLLGATLITGALTIDEFHNWYDCLAGAVIGSVMAISAYRMVYASVWDFRFNHIPLTRHTPFSYGAGQAGAGGFESAVFTRSAGWGYEEAYGGAPFDAAHGLRGQQAGFNNAAQGLHHGHGGGITGHKREGDVEHNAATTTGYNNNSVATNGHHNHNNNTSGSHGGGILSSIMPGHSNRHENFNTTTTGNGRDGDYVDEANNRNSGYGNEATTPTRDGRYQHHSRSLERKRLPAAPTGAVTRQSGEY